jgi:hypothetical protein
MEKYPPSCRKTDALSFGQKEVSKEKEYDLLGGTKVPSGNQKALSSMGISSWRALLVYQWDDLSGRGARKLAREDEDVPTMQGIPTYSGFTLREYQKRGQVLNYGLNLEVCGHLMSQDPTP